MGLSVGSIIWISIRPLIRLALCTSTGYLITKADIFPLVAARGTSQIALNIMLPSLMFSKIVPAFTSENISALGPLILVAIIYVFLGVLISWITKQFCWVPHRFRYGILVAGGWSNWGDVPTAVIISITASAPFNPATDQNLSVAYIAAFILVFFVSFFPLSGHRLVALDFVGPDVEDDELRMSSYKMAQQSLRHWSQSARSLRRRLSGKHEEGLYMDERPSDEEDPKMLEKGSASLQETKIDATEQIQQDSPRSRHVGFAVEESTVVPTECGTPVHTNALPSRVASPERGGDYARSHPPTSPSNPDKLPEFLDDPTSLTHNLAQDDSRKARLRKYFKHLRAFLRSLLNPPCLSILLALPISLITPLKALFTPIPNSPIPNAPDGQPPLAFILDTTTFIGNGSVPLGLICLGSALARLNIPRHDWRSLPLGAIGCLAVGKMIVMPVLGVLITNGLVTAGLIPADNKVLRFVCAFFSCVPTATTQVYVTQVYSGTGTAQHIAAFLIPQYAIMFLSMTALIAYSLSTLF